MKRLFEIDPWLVATHHLDKIDRRLQESITAVGNGYMGLRGNFEEGYSGDSLQGTYLGGVWFPDKTRVGWWKIGYPEYFGKVINAPSFLGIGITVNGEQVDLATSRYRDFYLALDLHQGLLTRRFVYIGDGVEVQFEFARFLSQTIKEAAFVSVKATVLRGHAAMTFDASLDGQVTNEDSNYDERFWVPLHEDAAAKSIQLQTKPNPYGVPQFTVLLKQQLRVNDQPVNGQVATTSGQLHEQVTVQLAEGQSYQLEKDAIVVTSRDVAPAAQATAAAQLMKQVTAQSFAAHLAAHTARWDQRWAKSDVVIEGDPAAQQGIRFNIAQLFMTYYGEDKRLNIGPKGFTGEKYGGATYWDTEAFIVPMYLAVTPSEVTRALLQYRHDQLPGAFHNARQQGLAGVLYPMVTFNGIECHNEWEITFEEIHRNAAIAFAIYQYTAYTGDESYVKHDGLEVLVGIARFWADRVHFSQRTQQYMIHGVTGPNEYENNVNNNWYTNTMAVWELQYTLERLAKGDADIVAALAVTDQEKQHWQAIIDHMYYPTDDQLGIFVQQDDFLDKDLRPASTIPADQRPINQHWSWDRILRSPFIKQADVLQGLYFLNDRFTKAEKERNFDFYEPLTVHESSLSPSIHAVLAAELGKIDKATELYARTARLDLDDYNHDTQDGLHITSMSGSWLAIVQGFAGMRYDHDQLRFHPQLPKNWRRYQFKLNYRGRLLAVDVGQKVTVSLLAGPSLDITIDGKTVHLEVEDGHA
ncbi:glycoside hydrolase family 65 protein [Lacticaseibacillus casei]|uniref:Glycoside hydrolase family 65 protein n=1 Tax=Lacticaseibacillus huelsenbergensis TaxID=3035291 RepID=A0ABY8DNE7_9LACO|nr:MULTISPECIES: glycoside hydrolase family 65 protein [Lacticaseibacillus]MDG3062666.1 glycoside hydrolase family 65 protein [Lacticaseibacillus sp. BCRC 81376]QVI38207.1 glycoside hydrolase family 65 protein [Lacticaseibacillus casei]QXG60021.1 glycoside hydrolase family 65 protein [Lacticaseibacillus casei]WFB38503.1 glycoside hydrolase family 65 protein [Lacticaseibacillus huelsenbergensis]WFB42927.1 glycoside hydrolase family 65 protein [Lacticaseibacillus huelsenbergensis]